MDSTRKALLAICDPKMASLIRYMVRAAKLRPTIHIRAGHAPPRLIVGEARRRDFSTKPKKYKGGAKYQKASHRIVVGAEYVLMLTPRKLTLWGKVVHVAREFDIKLAVNAEPVNVIFGYLGANRDRVTIVATPTTRRQFNRTTPLSQCGETAAYVVARAALDKAI